MRLSFCFIFSLVALSAAAQQAALTVHIEGIKAEEGKVLLALYMRESDFLGDDIFMGKEVHLKDGQANALFENLPYGKYAMSTFFDKNKNGLLDTNFIGIPKEPYAFSMNPNSRFGPPSFEEASFVLSSPNKTITITY